MAVKKSGVKGVTWDKRIKKWMAFVYKNYTTKYLGAYEKLEDAIKVRKEAEERLESKKKKKTVSTSKMKCRNARCLLNKKGYCDSPCRDWIEFTCANKDVQKKKEEKANPKTWINRTL